MAQRTKLLNIILNGDPDAGKGTQSERLLKKYPLVEMDLGKLLRKIALEQPNSTEAKQIRATVEKGKAAPTRLAREALRRFIETAPNDKGVLFSGSPYLIGEARLVYKWMNEAGRTPESVVVLYIRIPERETVRRMRQRRERVDGRLVRRPDDSPAALHQRITVARTNKQQVLNYFKTKYRTKVISGLGSRAEVWRRVQQAIHELTKTSHKEQRRH